MGKGGKRRRRRSNEMRKRERGTKRHVRGGEGEGIG